MAARPGARCWSGAGSSCAGGTRGAQALVWVESSTLLPLTSPDSPSECFSALMVMGLVQPQPLRQQVLGSWPWARICAVTSVTGPNAFSLTIIVSRDPLGHTVGSEGSAGCLLPPHPIPSQPQAIWGDCPPTETPPRQVSSMSVWVSLSWKSGSETSLLSGSQQTVKPASPACRLCKHFPAGANQALLAESTPLSPGEGCAPRRGMFCSSL